MDDKIAAQRIFSQKRETDSYNSWEEVYEETQRRNQEDSERYQRLYGIIYQDPKNFNLIVDTTEQTIEQTVEQILQSYISRQQKKPVSE